MRKVLFSFGAAIVLLLALQAPASAQLTFQAMLDGTQEVPPHNVPGTGFGSVILNSAMDQILVELGWADLTSGATAAHIHHGLPGVNGPVIFPIDLGQNAGRTSGQTDPQTFAITAEEVGWLTNNELYFNIHTTEFPGGEIRGQIVATPVPEPASAGLLALGGAALALAGGFTARRKNRIRGMRGRREQWPPAADRSVG